MLSRLLIGIAKLLAALFVLFSVYVVWSIVRENEAKKRATAFCERFQVGDSMADAARAASNEGDKLLRVIKEDHISLGYVGMYPYSRHFCIVDAKDGRIVGLRTSHLD